MQEQILKQVQDDGEETLLGADSLRVQVTLPFDCAQGKLAQGDKSMRRCD